MSPEAIAISIVDGVPTGILCAAFVACCILLSQLGLYVYERLNSHQPVSQSNDVAGIMFGGISLIYSLVLAFVFVAVWEDYEDLNKTIGTEADKLNSILSHSSTMPNSIKQPVTESLLAYCKQVIEKEWKMKKQAGIDQPSAIPNLRILLLKLEATNKLGKSILGVLDEDLSTISDLRRNRLTHNHSHIPALVWLILKSGSVMLIIFSYFFYVPSQKLKRIYLAFLSGFISMCMFLVYTLDNPFSGNAQVSYQPFVNILSELKEYNISNK